jgi:hypothetical protein
MMSSSKDFIEDSIEVEFWNGWEHLKSYLAVTEGYLKSSQQQFEAQIKKKKASLTDQTSNDIEIDNIDDLIFYADELPCIIWNSFFVSA